MKIGNVGVAGTMESSDIHITVEPSEVGGIRIYLKSPVIQQFGEEIERVINLTLKRMDIENATVRAIDKGALNCTIEARVACAVMRATGQHFNIWEVVENV